jgi:hypothetical protein
MSVAKMALFIQPSFKNIILESNLCAKIRMQQVMSTITVCHNISYGYWGDARSLWLAGRQPGLRRNIPKRQEIPSGQAKLTTDLASVKEAHVAYMTRSISALKRLPGKPTGAASGQYKSVKKTPLV